MPNSYKDSPSRGVSSGSDILTSSSYSLSLSSSGSGSSRSSTSSAPASVDGVVTPGPTEALQRKPFVPPKIIRPKKIPSVKKALPKRTPFPNDAGGVGGAAAGGTSEPKAGPAPSRKDQLAALQSQLLMSRAAIGQRWKEAWRSAESSAFSFDSDEDEIEGLDSSDSSPAATPATRKRGGAEREAKDNMSSVISSLGASEARQDLLQLLQREMSSSSSDLLHDSSQILNLTASDFIDDLKADFAPHEGGEIRPATPDEETVMSRPLRKLKLHLFQEGHPTSSSSSDGSSDESQASVRGRQIPSRETSVPGELDEDLHDSEDEEKDDEEKKAEGEEKDGEAEEEESSASQPQAGEGTEEAYMDRDMDTNGSVNRESEDQGPAVELSESAEDEPQMVWEFEEQEDKPPPPPPKKTIVVRRPLKAEDMAVEERLEADACQEDFDRREIADRIIYEYTDDPLSPQMERLKAERVQLAEWARRLRGGNMVQAEGDRPAGYRPPLVRQPALRGVGRTFPKTQVDRPLTSDLSPRGEGIEERMLQRAALPSTKVWQMEQRTKRLQQQTAQQQQQLEILQAALRKKIEATSNPGADAVEGGSSVARSSTDTTDATEGLSPRSAELKLYEQQCVYLGAQLEEEHEFCEAYRAELGRALLKNMALKKQYGDAVDALKQREAAERKERAEHLQAEEQLRDLQDRIEAEKNKMMIERSCRQQRDKQTTTLQERYTQLLHYLQEAEEKRSSFEDGLRVAQSKAQKAEALLQTKEAELAYVQRCLETLDVQMLEKEVQRRKERDRANAAERQVEELRASLAAKEQEISKLMKNSENGVTLLEKEQKEHLKTREALAAAQATLKQQAAELQAPHLQQHKLDSIRKLAKDFQALSDEAEAEEREMEAWHTEVEERRAKALSILEEAERSAIAVFSQLDKGAADASAVSELSQQMEALRQARQEEMALLEHEFELVGRQRKKLEADLQQREKEATELREQIASLTRKLQRQAQKNRRIAKRIIRTASAYGRSSRRTVCRELRTMRVGGVVEMLSRSTHRRPEPRYIKMFKRGVVMWSEDLAGNRGFRKGDQFAVTDIVGIDFGTSSSAFLWSLHGTRGGKAPSTQFAYPWRCFTVRTLKDTFEFRAKSDEAAQDWVVGLGRLSSTHAPPMISDKHEFIVHRVHMKLAAYAAQRGITPAVMWREAINKTCAQLPHLRQRAAASRRRDSSEAVALQEKNSTSSQKHLPHVQSDASPSRSISPHKEHRRHAHQDRRRESHRRGPREATRGAEQTSGQHRKHSHATKVSPSQNEIPSPSTAAAAAVSAGTSSHSPRKKSREAAANPDEITRRRISSRTPASRNQREEGERPDSPPPEPTPEHKEDKTRGHAKMHLPDAKPSRHRGQQRREQTGEEGNAPAPGELNSVKKKSKGILSRAGTLFKKQAAKKTGE